MTAAVFLAAACSRPDRAVPVDSSSTLAARGPDALALRIPIAGGAPRVVGYPDLDSTVWTGSVALPPIARVVAFDDNEGVFLFTDPRGRGVRLDLDAGIATVLARDAFASLASTSGAVAFAVDAKGVVHRYSPEGEWTFAPPTPARDVFPQRNGTIAVLSRGDSAALWLVRPPSTDVLDTLPIGKIDRVFHTLSGDRAYALSGDRLLPIDVRTLTLKRAIEGMKGVRALAATPSGDRVFVSIDSSNELLVVDRYRERVAARIALPRPAGELRVDLLGRALLVQDPSRDSVWVIATDSHRIVATLPSRWRGDLPLVAPDGGVMTLQGKDVVLYESPGWTVRRRIAAGGTDFWHTFWWTGFRPTAASLEDSLAALRDSTDSLVVATDSGVAKKDSVAPPPGFMLQLATLLGEQRARDLAATIQVGGETARVESSLVSGTPVYRVVMGPYPTREEAERVARLTGLQFCVMEGGVCR